MEKGFHNIEQFIAFITPGHTAFHERLSIGVYRRGRTREFSPCITPRNILSVLPEEMAEISDILDADKWFRNLKEKAGLSKKVTNILETFKLLAFSDPFPIEQDCIHLHNGVYHLPDGSFQESRLFCQNRLKALFNPLLMGSIFMIVFLNCFGVPYADYKSSAQPVSWLLMPATVSLAILFLI